MKIVDTRWKGAHGTVTEKKHADGRTFCTLRHDLIFINKNYVCTPLYREKFWKRTSPICLTVINELWDSDVRMLSRGRLCNPMDCSPPGSSVHGFSRREYWSGVPFPPPGDLPHPGIELMCLKSPALAGRFFTMGAIWDLDLIWWKRLLNTHKLSPPHTKPSSIYILHLKQQQQKNPSTLITFKKASHVRPRLRALFSLQG